MNEQQNLNFILLNAGHAVHEGDWNWKNIKSPYFRLYLVDEGEAGIEVEGKFTKLTPNHLYIIPPFAQHSYSCDSHFALYYLHIYEEQLQGSSLFEQMRFPTEVSSLRIDEFLMKRIIEINPGRGLSMYDPSSYDNNTNLYKRIAEHTHDSLHTRIETSGIIRQLFSRFLKDAERKIISQDSRIIKILKFIRENINHKISVNDLASLSYLSEDHFIRLFKKEMGTTPVEYINIKKVETAQLMLVINDIPVKDVACALSFDNISYFNRLFKQVTGETPTQYRERYQ